MLYVKLTGVEIANKHETIRPSGIFDHKRPGTMVAVRPCDEACKGKTYLGMYLCDAPTGVTGEQIGDKVVLTMNNYQNPAIYVPDLDKIVWGYDSWWGEIKSEGKLREITDADIQNQWYVRALAQLEQQHSATPEKKLS
ncbi:MAG: hypothetical protein LBK99_16600 [Opitutaceae bacterium]|jgi:hypothetical protein|nr:hypothetical protein [Opitutaceae bacterium]